MNRLEEYLGSHDEQDFRDLLNKPLNEFTGLAKSTTFRELTENYDILVNVLALGNYNADILWLIEYDNEIIKFKWLSKYTMLVVFLFMLIFPILVSNYWLYFALLLIPVSIFASGVIKTPIQTIFWLVIIGLTLYSLFTENYEINGMTLPLIVMVISIKRAKKLYMDTLVKSSLSNELNFKFLWYIEMIQLYNRQTRELFSINNIE